MLSEITQKTTSQIAQELRKTFESPSAGSQPLLGSSSRVGAVEAWLDLRRAADGATRHKIDDAIQEALTPVLFESAVDPETVCAHLRLLRLAAQEKRGTWSVSNDAKRAVLGAIQSERYKGVQTSYGDTHGELLACAEALELAPNWEFWVIQMCDTRYVTHAVSGCLGSGNEQWALNGVIRAAILEDRSLALALMRLFRMFQGREHFIFCRFEEARRNGAWTREVFDRASRSAAQIGYSFPSDASLELERDVASLRAQLHARDRLLKQAQTKAMRAIRGENRIKTQMLSPLERIQTIRTKERVLQAEYDREFRQLEEIASLPSEDVQEPKSEPQRLEQRASEGVHKRSTRHGMISIDSKGSKRKRVNDISGGEQ